MLHNDHEYLSFGWHLASLTAYATVTFPIDGNGKVEVAVNGNTYTYPNIMAAYWHIMGKLGILPHKPAGGSPSL